MLVYFPVSKIFHVYSNSTMFWVSHKVYVIYTPISLKFLHSGAIRAFLYARFGRNFIKLALRF